MHDSGNFVWSWLASIPRILNFLWLGECHLLAKIPVIFSSFSSYPWLAKSTGYFFPAKHILAIYFHKYRESKSWRPERSIFLRFCQQSKTFPSSHRSIIFKILWVSISGTLWWRRMNLWADVGILTNSNWEYVTSRIGMLTFIVRQTLELFCPMKYTYTDFCLFFPDLNIHASQDFWLQQEPYVSRYCPSMQDISLISLTGIFKGENWRET